MKKILFTISILFFTLSVFGQTEGKGIITKEMELKLKSEIEKQIPSLKAQLLKEEKGSDEIEFTLDTFRINQLVLKRMEIDFTTQGMNFTVRQQASSYDKLMNKYYNKLLAKLDPDAKKILISTQKSWISFRDNETKLIWLLSEQQYSGGGTIQSNIATDHCSELTIQRTIVIFNYYLTIVEAASR